MFSDDYLQDVIGEAKRETECVEQRTIAKLYDRGDMANLTCEGQREVEARVRELLTA